MPNLLLKSPQPPSWLPQSLQNIYASQSTPQAMSQNALAMAAPMAPDMEGFFATALDRDPVDAAYDAKGVRQLLDGSHPLLGNNPNIAVRMPEVSYWSKAVINHLLTHPRDAAISAAKSLEDALMKRLRGMQ